MSQQQLLSRVITEMRHLNVPCMLTGSLVSSLQGEPRSTHDIDLVVDLRADRIEELLRAFSSSEFYVSRSAVEEAVLQRRMFNLLELLSGDKVDFWLLTDSPFDQSRFARRRTIEFDGIVIDVSSPEDTILMKLKWAMDSGGSEKQFHDALRVFEVHASVLDLNYLDRWVTELAVSELWDRLLSEAQPIE